MKLNKLITFTTAFMLLSGISAPFAADPCNKEDTKSFVPKTYENTVEIKTNKGESSIMNKLSKKFEEIVLEMENISDEKKRRECQSKLLHSFVELTFFQDFLEKKD